MAAADLVLHFTQCSRFPLRVLRQQQSNRGLKVVARLRRDRLARDPPVLHRSQLELLHQLGTGHRAEQVLLVGKHKHGHASELVLAAQLSKLLGRLVDAPLVRRVDDVDDRVRVGVIVLPVRPDVLLAANVPHVELEATS